MRNFDGSNLEWIDAISVIGFLSFIFGLIGIFFRGIHSLDDFINNILNFAAFEWFIIIGLVVMIGALIYKTSK